MNCFAAPSVIKYLLHSAWVSETCRNLLSDRSLNGVFGVSAGAYAYVFLLTLAFELPIYYFSLKKQLSPLRLLLAVLFLNLATHPLVVLGIPQFVALAEQPKLLAIVIGEIFAPIAEGLFLWSLLSISWKRAIIVAFAANFFSWSVGHFFIL